MAAKLLLHAMVLVMSCAEAMGLRRADQFMNTRSSKASGSSTTGTLDNYRNYTTGVVIFGDSTVDVGVNNYLLTAVKSNFEPYGRVFQGRVPTGRFCDGKLTVDFIAEKIGYPFSLPYLAPFAHGAAILTGINFASSASGWNDLTAFNFNVKNLGDQLAWYQNWKNEVKSLVGEERGAYIIKNALNIISTGANDWVNNYYLNPLLQKQYTPETYTTFLIDKARSFIQELFRSGGNNIAVLGLPPLGCLPSQITLHGKGKPDCIAEYNAVAVQFNVKFIAMIDELTPTFRGGRLVYLDIYYSILDIVQNPGSYGVTELRNGCCGTGVIETGPLCNKLSIGTCQDADAYLWWDSFHPTQHVNSILAGDLFNQAVTTLTGPVLP